MSQRGFFKNWGLKLIAAIACFAVLASEDSPHLTQILGLNDVGFAMATPLYVFLKGHPVLFWWILLIDTIFVFSCAFFVIYQFLFKNRIHFGIQVLLMYIIRSFSMRLFELPIPEEVLWHFPGFPSNICSDFFFSGHIGLAAMTGMQLFDMNWKYLGITVGFVLNFAQIVLFMATRAHYTADCITGFTCGIAIIAAWKFFGYGDMIDDENEQKNSSLVHADGKNVVHREKAE